MGSPVLATRGAPDESSETEKIQESVCQIEASSFLEKLIDSSPHLFARERLLRMIRHILISAEDLIPFG